MRNKKTLAVALASAALVTTPAWAHPGHDFTANFSAGFFHPLTGLDHVIAMVALGLWAARQQGRTRWLLPGAFVAFMAVGALITRVIALPAVEASIVASVVLLGLLIAFASRPNTLAAMAIAGLFALCHGYAHGAADTLNSTYLLGMLTCTAALHIAGVALGGYIKRHTSDSWRWVGGSIAASGIAMAVASIAAG